MQITDAKNVKRFQPGAFFISLGITLFIGMVASYFTRTQIPVWYRLLLKPSFTPPNWVFPVAWTTLYILIATSAYLVWKRRFTRTDFKKTSVIYAIQLMLNFSWSIVFFGMHQIFGGLINIIILWIFIILNIIAFSKYSKTAAWLLVPYLIWVSYATILNLAILTFNPNPPVL